MQFDLTIKLIKVVLAIFSEFLLINFYFGHQYYLWYENSDKYVCSHIHLLLSTAQLFQLADFLHVLQKISFLKLIFALV